MKNVVFIDSNAIIGNQYDIKSQSLKNFFKRNKLVLSDVTLEEVIRKYKKYQDEKKKDLIAAIKEAGRYGVGLPNYEEENIVNFINIEKRLHRELNELNFLLLNKETVDINDIFVKSMSLKKPFKKNGKDKEMGGFRDVLIWFSWLNYLKESHEEYDTIVIVNNDGDFIDKEKDALHAELAEDLENNNIPINKVKVIKGIKGLLEYSREEMNNLNNSVTEEVVKESIEAILERIGIRTVETIKRRVEKDIPADREPEIRNIERKHQIDIDIAEGTEENLSLYFNEKYVVDVEYFIDRSDYFTSPKKNISIVNGEWNSHVMLVSESFNIEVGFETNYNNTTSKINDDLWIYAGELEPVLVGYDYEDEYQY